MTSLSIHAPAKINLFLHVLGRRPNGYHDLFMLMIPLSLADEISLEEIDRGIELYSDHIDVAPEKNLAWRAAKIFQETTHISKGVRIHLEKLIPVAAGLGGGSSDAAAVLLGLNRLWNVHMSPQELANMGVKLGADVPFFCYEKAALVEGIGDRVTPLDTFPKLFLLLVNPGISVSTADVYRRWDELDKAHLPPPPLKVRGGRGSYDKNRNPSQPPLILRGGGIEEIISLLHNDLEEVTIPMHPEIAKVKESLKEYGAKGVLMSGSGSTVFGIFENEERREDAKRRLTNPSWKVIAAESL